MKRIIAAVLLVTLLLCSCSNGIINSGVSLNVNSLNTAFSFKCGETIYSGDMKISQSDEITMMLTSPETVNGITFNVSQDSVKATFGETTVSSISGDTKNAFSQLFYAVNTLKTAEKLNKNADGYELKNDSFSAELDSKGNLKKLKINKGEFYFK